MSTKPRTQAAVSLNAEQTHLVDTIGLNFAMAVEGATGVPVELSRAQIIHAIAKDALKRQDAAADQADAEAEGDEDNENGAGE